LGEGGNGGLVDALEAERLAVANLTTQFTPLIDKIDEVIDKLADLAEDLATEITENAQGKNHDLKLDNDFSFDTDYSKEILSLADEYRKATSQAEKSQINQEINKLFAERKNKINYMINNSTG
jgi:ElaB/YqjD/DUF883 family membrane-anchored ribosome-binding protein